MSTIALYECTRLSARITLASCEANRDKPDNAAVFSESRTLVVRPWACRTCTDWQAWNNTNAVEVTVSNFESKKPNFVCASCGAETRNAGKGLCKLCYQRQKRAEHKTKQAVLVPVPVSAPVPVPTPAPVPVVQQEADPKPATCTKIRRIYLACPYTSTDVATMTQRLAAATSAANTLIRQGHNIFSPISHGAEVGKDLPPDFAFWSTSCLSFVKHWATDVYVLMLPGWEASVGVTAEVNAAKALNIPVTHILPLPCNHGLPLAV